MTTRVVDETKQVIQKAKAASIKSLSGAGAYIRGIVRRSISKRRSGTPSLPGKTPRSPTGRLRDSIAFVVDRVAQTVVVGPARSAIALIGRTHEFGGLETKEARRRRQLFDLRIGGWGPIRVRGTSGRKDPRIAEVLATLSRLRGGAPAPADNVDPARRRIMDMKKRLVVARIRTAEQLRRAREIVAGLEIPPWESGQPSSSKTRLYPRRPFMQPALLRSRDRLPAFWRNRMRGN